MRTNSFSLLFVALIFTAAPLVVGCAARSEKTVSTVEVSREPAVYDESSRVERTETTKVEEEHEHGHGVFSILGDIVALPFRAVGGLFGAIFS